MSYQKAKDKIKQEAIALATKVRETGEYPIAYVVTENDCQVGTICPYCKRLHWHGKAGGDPEGSRVPHCVDLQGMPSYIVKWPEHKV